MNIKMTLLQGHTFLENDDAHYFFRVESFWFRVTTALDELLRSLNKYKTRRNKIGFFLSRTSELVNAQVTHGDSRGGVKATSVANGGSDILRL
jgi:hypothetical protein